MNLVTSGSSVGNLLTHRTWANHSRDNSAPIVSIGRTRPAWMPSLPLKCHFTSPKGTIDMVYGTMDIAASIEFDYDISKGPSLAQMWSRTMNSYICLRHLGINIRIRCRDHGSAVPTRGLGLTPYSTLHSHAANETLAINKC